MACALAEDFLDQFAHMPDALRCIPSSTISNVTELENAIHEWIEHRNQDPKHFTWTAKAKPILASHRRAQKALAIVNAGCK